MANIAYLDSVGNVNPAAQPLINRLQEVYAKTASGVSTAGDNAAPITDALTGCAGGQSLQHS